MIRCRCGELYHADEAHVGRVLHCPCGRNLEVRLPPPRGAPAGPSAGRAAAAGAPRSLRDR
ncbi:MAG: hypothetical protein AB1941_24740, partial [Gemmatimonadota bacterium]